MFPLGSVVFPYTAVPLRVFEPRYQEMLDDVLASDRRFGSVLIERGPEVGGGDQRFDVGSLVTVSGVSRLPEEDHRLVVVTGSARIRVDSWHPDDPYPVADVELFPDDDEEVAPGLVDGVRARIRTVLALASELGADTGPITAELSDDPVTASYQAAALTPVTALDAHRLLTAAGPASRLLACIEMLEESSTVLRRRLEEG